MRLLKRRIFAPMAYVFDTEDRDRDKQSVKVPVRWIPARRRWIVRGARAGGDWPARIL
jgi:hypothetical protein